MEALCVKRLKVKELRSELQKRGLEKNGVKSTLVARLGKSLELEKIQLCKNNTDKDTDMPLASTSTTKHTTMPNIAEMGSANLFQQILDVIRGSDDRLNTLERNMSDQISIITEHIESQNNTFRRVNEERQSLQKITELLSNAEADMKSDKAKPQAGQNRIHVPAVSTHNRFEIFAEEADNRNPSQSYAEQIAEYRQRQRT